MLFNNPIFDMELKLKMKTVSIPVLIMLYNIFFALLSIIILISFSELSNEGWDGAILDLTSIFCFMGMIQGVLIYVFAPFFTADAICGEKRRKTLDLLLASPISLTRIVLGKMSVNIFLILLFSLSSFPILAVGFLYSGIGTLQILYFFFVLFITAFLCVSIGIFASSFMKQIWKAVILSLFIEFLLTAGNFIALFFLENTIWNGNLGGRSLMGGLTLLNPSILLLGLYDALSGTNNMVYVIMYYFNVSQDSTLCFLMDKLFIPLNMLIQFLTGSLFLSLTVKRLKISTLYKKEERRFDRYRRKGYDYDNNRAIKECDVWGEKK